MFTMSRVPPFSPRRLPVPSSRRARRALLALGSRSHRRLCRSCFSASARGVAIGGRAWRPRRPFGLRPMFQGTLLAFALSYRSRPGASRAFSLWRCDRDPRSRQTASGRSNVVLCPPSWCGRVLGNGGGGVGGGLFGTGRLARRLALPNRFREARVMCRSGQLGFVRRVLPDRGGFVALHGDCSPVTGIGPRSRRSVVTGLCRPTVGSFGTFSRDRGRVRSSRFREPWWVRLSRLRMRRSVRLSRFADPPQVRSSRLYEPRWVRLSRFRMARWVRSSHFADPRWVRLSRFHDPRWVRSVRFRRPWWVRSARFPGRRWVRS